VALKHVVFTRSIPKLYYIDHDPCEASHSGRDLQTSGPSSSMGDSYNTPDEFTAEEESHFARRYEEGFDLPNPRYVTWLKS